MTDQVLIDGHVHIYPSFNLAAFLAAAQRNFPGPRGCLLLTETARDAAFAALKGGAALPEGWQGVPLPEDPAALRLQNAAGELLLIAGYQLVSQEGIEVLTLCTTDRWPDGLPLPEILEGLAQAGQPAVLPWGVGKWIGRRGKILAQVLAQGLPPGVHLGDNAGRPGFWAEPPLFKQARAKGIAVLPGSDPLPVAGGDQAPGRFGFCVPGALDPHAPARDLSGRLLALSAQPKVFGRRSSGMAFVHQQVMMRLK